MNDYTIILLHGWGQIPKAMNPLEEDLKQKYKVINVEYLKINNKVIYDMNDYVEDLHKRICNFKNVVLIGHSFGGKLASFYALRYKVKKIILLAPSTYIKKTIKTKLKIYMYKLAKILNLHSKLKIYESKDYQKLHGIERETFKNILKNIKKNELKKLDLKVLLIGFKNDKQVPIKNIYFLKKNLNNSKLFVYEGDHFAYLDHLEEIIVNIMEFIDYD